MRQTGKLLTFTRTSYFLPFTFYLSLFTFHLAWTSRTPANV